MEGVIARWDGRALTVFYDLTTLRAAGLSQQDKDVCKYGMAKEGVIARQFMLGVVHTAEGLPICISIHSGEPAAAAKRCIEVTLIPRTAVLTKREF